jgi:hypothetical protein
MDRPFQDRSELVAFVGRQAPTPAIRRACVEGTVEVLGAFYTTCSSNAVLVPGFMVRVTSRHGREWLVSVCPSADQREWVLCVRSAVRWEHYTAESTVSGRAYYSIYAGDHPLKYLSLKTEALNEAARTF